MADAAVPIKIYDFRRPDKFSRDQIHTLARIHEAFARLASVTLSARLRSLVSVHLKLVDQLTYAEITDSLPSPTTLGVGSMTPLKGSALFEINPTITFALLDRLFGGSGDGGGLTRDLTEIEQAQMEVLLARLWTDLGSAWAQVFDLKPQLTQLEVNPMFAQIVPPHEMVVLVQFEVKLGLIEETLNLVIPYLTIEPLLFRLSSQFWYANRPHRSTDEEQTVIAGRMADLPVSAEVVVEGQSLSLKALGALKKGSLVALPGATRGEAFLRVGGRPLFRLKQTGRPSSYTVEEGPTGGLPRSRSSAPGPGVRQAIEDLRSDFETSVSKIAGGLDELHRQQDVLSDLLSLPAAEAQRPFSFLDKADPVNTARFFAFELPQLVALVLSHLDVPPAAALLGALASEVQPEVVRRIAALEPPGAETVALVERVLKRKLEVAATSSFWQGGGVELAARILSGASRSTEKHVVDALAGVDPGLTASLRERLFAFDDIPTLDPSLVAPVLAAVDLDVVARALAGTPDTVKEFVLGCLPVGSRKAVVAKVGGLGRVGLKEGQAAQRQIVGLIKESGG